MRIKKVTAFILTMTMMFTLSTGISFGAEPSNATNPVVKVVNSDKLIATATSTTSTGFTDINGHWAESVIKEAASQGIVGGYPDGKFMPDNLIKREEFYKLLSNILTTKPDTSTTTIKFRDVVDYEWYVPTIKTAVAAGITSGYDDGTFGIGLMISRQEAAKVAGSVINTSGVENNQGAETAKDKSQIAEWAYNYVNLMFKKGYMKGDTEGNFRPTTALTRAEAATILLNVKKHESVIAPSALIATTSAAVTTTNSCILIHSGMEGVFAKGEGTPSQPYQVETEEQLNHIREHSTAGAFYVLTKNIAITKDYTKIQPSAASGEPDWTVGNFQPIGTKEAPFKGNLDGDGYTISGLVISGTQERNDKNFANYAGLFGYLGQGSTVKDLTIEASSFTGNQFTGSIAGYNEGIIKNCQLGSKGIINGNVNTGGLVGYSAQPLNSLRNLGTVNGKSKNTGGIVGEIMAPGTALIYCQNEGVVIGLENTGGVAGSFASALTETASVKECYNKGQVQSGAYNAGGVIGTASGQYYSITVDNCGNSGTVSGSGINGGIAGTLKDNNATISNSKNTGEVIGNGAGGVAGYNQGLITSCYNGGTVKAKLNGGGIAAYQEDGDGKITKSYNEGTVYSSSFAGGIIGENGSRVDNCYNSGKVSGNNSIGGIAGKNTNNVTNVYNAGDVTGENGFGAIIGRNAGKLTNAYWLESKGSSPVGLIDSSATQSTVSKVSHDELSGQLKIKTSKGYEMLIDIMNTNNATSADIINKTTPAKVWEYLYTLKSAASIGETTVISDGGGVVAPISFETTDIIGNVISDSDINTKYLYPSIIK